MFGWRPAFNWRRFLTGKWPFEVHWPASSMIAAVRRRGELIVPRGDTMLHAGDLLTVVTTPGHEHELAEVIGTGPDSTH